LREHPIPARLNLVLLAVTTGSATALQTVAAGVETGAGMILCGGAFAVTLVTLYTLFHEAAHGLAHPDPRVNRGMGRILGIFFGVPFSFFRHGHLGHHRRNRTDSEMFDLYYESDNRFLKILILWSILAGLFYVVFVLLGLALLVAPRPLIRWARGLGMATNAYVIGSMPEELLPSIRGEMVLILAAQGALFLALGWRLESYLLLYGCHAVFWSSQDYARHAFSPRDILDGAHNLRRNRLASWVFLNNNFHKAHHRNPRVSWIHLPGLVTEQEMGPPLWQNYLRMLKGPELTLEPPPKSLDRDFEIYRQGGVGSS
jgi:fatty acid desaturase